MKDVTEQDGSFPEADDLDADLDAERATNLQYESQTKTISTLLDVFFELRRCRLALGLSLDELAGPTGGSPIELEEIEDNNVDVSADLIRRYAGAVGLVLEYHLAAES
jgi:hypothetical protein